MVSYSEAQIAPLRFMAGIYSHRNFLKAEQDIKARYQNTGAIENVSEQTTLYSSQ